MKQKSIFKKLISVILILICAVSVVSCDEKKNEYLGLQNCSDCNAQFEAYASNAFCTEDGNNIYFCPDCLSTRKMLF